MGERRKEAPSFSFHGIRARRESHENPTVEKECRGRRVDAHSDGAVGAVAVLEEGDEHHLRHEGACISRASIRYFRSLELQVRFKHPIWTLESSNDSHKARGSPGHAPSSSSDTVSPTLKHQLGTLRGADAAREGFVQLALRTSPLPRTKRVNLSRVRVFQRPRTWARKNLRTCVRDIRVSRLVHCHYGTFPVRFGHDRSFQRTRARPFGVPNHSR